MDLKFGHLVASSNEDILQFCINSIAQTDEKSKKNQNSFMTLVQLRMWHAEELADLKCCNCPRILEDPKLVVSVWKKGDLIAVR